MVPWPRRGYALIRDEPGHKQGLARSLRDPCAPFSSHIHSAVHNGPSACAALFCSLLTGIKRSGQEK